MCVKAVVALVTLWFGESERWIFFTLRTVSVIQSQQFLCVLKVHRSWLR